jgi:hypothetical protein
MDLFLSLILVIIGIAALIIVIWGLRNSQLIDWRQKLPIPEIPVELAVKPEPDKIFLDPLLMQLHGEDTVTVPIVLPTGREMEVLVNCSSAEIFREKGWGPFRDSVRQWIDSPAYCRCGPRFGHPDIKLGELALSYLYGELLGDAQFERAFSELETFWIQNAERFGWPKPNPMQ